MLQNLIEMIYGAANVSYSFAQGGLHHVGPFLWTTSNIEVIISALAVAGLIYLLLQRTRFGKAIRAVSQDRTLAQVSGIPARQVVMGTWALAGAIAGFAGFILADTIGTFGPSSGSASCCSRSPPRWPAGSDGPTPRWAAPCWSAW